MTELVRLPKGEPVRPLAANNELRAKVGALARKRVEFFKLPIGDGVQVDGWRILPPDFDPAKKYPLLVYVYGEPAGQTVQDSWGGSGYLWHLMLAQRGYIVASFDNRGTPAPRGRAWRKIDLPADRHPGLGRSGGGGPGGDRRLALRRPRARSASGAGAAAGR